MSLSRNLPLQEKVYIVTLSADDGGGLTSELSATVHVSVTGSSYPRPTFSNATYIFSVMENIAAGSRVGFVEATVASPNVQGMKICNSTIL